MTRIRQGGRRGRLLFGAAVLGMVFVGIGPSARADTSAARERGHRLPQAHRADRAVPEGGWDLRYQDQLQALAEHVARRTLRIEAIHRPPAPYDPTHPGTEDGAGVVLAAGRLLTTARYLVGAHEVRVVGRDGRAVPARVERLDEERDLALVVYEAARIPGVQKLTGFASLPDADADGGASTVVVPSTLVGVSASVQVAALLQSEEGVLFLSGQLANGIPAFDHRGRLVALADRPTPDRTRSVAYGAETMAAWAE